MLGSNGLQRDHAATASESGRVHSGVGPPVTPRARVLTAAVALVGEVGYAGMSVERVVRRSGISQETFDKYFDDLDDCLLAAFEDALGRIAAVLVPAYEGEREWPAKVRAAVTALLAVLDDEPTMSMFVFVGALGAGPKVLACRMEALARLNIAFEHGIDEAGMLDGSKIGQSSPLSAEGAVNAVLGILHTRMLEGSPLARRPLSELAGPLTAMIVLPYVGHAAASSEVAPARSRSPTASRVGAGEGAASNGNVAASNGVAVVSNGHDRSGRMLQGLDVRVSERGFKVLAAIDALGAQGSGPSNREIGDAAGIKDQGQVSKLMKQLARLGLVENIGAGELTGRAYAWRLTAKGKELLRELEGQASNGAAASNGHDRSAVTKAMLEGLETPISKRELEVLTAIGELNARGSSPSNREIGNAMQIHDPTQLSKLIKHLAELWLVENTGWIEGKQYAWRLTSKGTDLLRELEGQTVGA